MSVRCLRYVCLFVFLAINSFSANATQRTDQFKWMCENDIQKLICAGYISAVTDTLVLLSDVRKKESGKSYVCTPPHGISNDQAMKIVMKYINSHPEEWHKTARVTVMIALMDAFKCKN